MTENWDVLPHHPEVLFSMLPQVFLLFHEAAKQQNLSTDNSRFSGWSGGMENSSGLGEEHCESSTQSLGALNSTGMIPSLTVHLLCEQVLCQYIYGLKKLRKGSSISDVHGIWLWEITASL